MRFLKTDKLYCFSPPVMIATFLLEIGFALYVVARYKLTPVSRLAVFVLLGLAVFQLAEYNICETPWGVDSLTWARIGHVAITLLPPLGLHLAATIAGQKKRRMISAAYASAFVFSCVFMFAGQGITSEQCLGNYVIFDLAPWATWPFTFYYYGLLILTVGLAVWWAKHQKKPRVKAALYSLAVGYLTFIVPTTIVNIIDPSTIAGIPSIMCGFAVILAALLALRVVPAAHQKRKT